MNQPRSPRRLREELYLYEYAHVSRMRMTFALYLQAIDTSLMHSELEYELE
jgi:hypothetical protein